MNRAKIFASLLLALMLVLAMASPTLAAGGGSIAINNAVPGQTYTIYKILDLETYNPETKAYSYKATPEWKAWLETQTAYVTVGENDYVTWVENADAAAFAQAAKDHIASVSSIRPAMPAVEAESNEVSFEGLDLGYYLMDSTLGALCSLDTTRPDVAIEEKNAAPTIEKKVEEDSTGIYGDINDADIGQTVNFRTTIHAKKGARNYVLHDQMESGLSLDKESIVVRVGEHDLTQQADGKAGDYTVAFDVSCKDVRENDATCDFEITFTQAFLDSLTSDMDIVVTYEAVLNENAEIHPGTNDNTTVLNYGNNSRTVWDTTQTKTFQFDIVKTDGENKVLTGAEFALYDAEEGGNLIPVVKGSDGVYRVATEEERSASGFTSAVIEAGRATVKGLDANTTYWLEETRQPAGYNALDGRVEVSIVTANLTTTMSGDTWTDGDGGIHIENQAGVVMPSTGGMGTTILYVTGGILMVGAAVILIVRRRMDAEK